MPTPMVVIEPRPDRLPATAEPPAARKPRRIRRMLAWIAAVAFVWCAWAAYALYDLATALDNEDAVALARRVDWVAVREGLRADLRATPAGGSGRDGPMPERTIETMVGARSVVHLIREARLNDAGWEGALPSAASAAPDHGFQWFRIRYAFFSGGPFAIRVDLRPDSDSVKRPLVLLMRWSGDWRLERVFLPSDSRFGAAHAARAAPRLQAAAAPKMAPAVAPKSAPDAAASKAILYEEDGSDPNGKSFTGTVSWRTAQTPAAPGQPSETEVRAEVDVPDRPMKLKLAIRRNTDRSLPASHIFDVRIEVPADSTTGGIQDVPGIMMKAGEDARSVALAGVSVKVSADYYMVGLSSSDENVRLNTDMLRQRPWIDVPIRYNNTKRAILSFEKGEAGSKAIEAALASWSTAAASAAKN